MSKEAKKLIQQNVDFSKYSPTLSEQDYKRASRYAKIFRVLHRCVQLDKVSIVEDRKTMEEAQSLLYQEYYKRDLCTENSEKRYFSSYHYGSSSTTLVSRKNDKVIGTISVYQDSDMRLPSDILYPEELAMFRDMGKRIVEVSALALDHTKFGNTYSLKSFKKMNSLFSLFCGMINYIYQFIDATDIVIMVNPKHVSLYTFLGFQAYSQSKFYSKVGKIPVPMILDIEQFISTADKSAPAYNVIANFRKFPDCVPFRFTSTELAEKLFLSLGWKSISDREFVGLLDVDPELLIKN